MNRRQFIFSALNTAVLYGGGAVVPWKSNVADAGFVSLQNRLLVNLMLDGGPDMRHLIAPAWQSSTQSVGNKYWKNRWRSHRLPNNSDSVLQQRWEEDYIPITVGGSGWTTGGGSSSLLNDVSRLNNGVSVNNGVTFGIWKEAAWLIDMFLKGNVAIVCNAVGGQNRDHAHSTKIMEQGNIEIAHDSPNGSGWGGRLAQHAGGTAVALTNVPRHFCFGAKNGDQSIVDKSTLVSFPNSRQFGLYGIDPAADRAYDHRQKVAASMQTYFGALEQDSSIMGRMAELLGHEQDLRYFGELVNERLDFAEPLLVRALYSGFVDGSGSATGINESPLNGESRRTLRLADFGMQVRNLYDAIASNDIFGMRVASMAYPNWDSHVNQRGIQSESDPNNPEVNRGIESGFKDIFGGPGGSDYSLPNALHGGLSALWNELPQIDQGNIVFNIAGEFGRQLRDNSDLGTDHGSGNVMLVIGTGVRGGVYGELFPETEIAKIDDFSIKTPDIDPLTDFDHIFGATCDWVSGSSGNLVFPNRTTNQNIENGVTFSDLMV